MELNETPLANRLHISFFGCRNAGKSSLVNAVTGQNLSVISDIPGTTTDPVFKTMELLPLGPVVIIDTPGYDDVGALGKLRVEKTKQILRKTDLAILVIDVSKGQNEYDKELIHLFQEHKINYLIVMNKADLITKTNSLKNENEADIIYVSTKLKNGIHELKEAIGKMTTTETLTMQLVGDLLTPSDFIVLVTPIDASAPKGRLILPQQQMIRDVLEANCTAIVVRETELSDTLTHLGKDPSLVITDSQVFAHVNKIVPSRIPLTSFSILMARYKGSLETSVLGAAAIDHLKEHDTVLISEGCTHHRQCNDIGSVKIPRWLQNYTKKNLNIVLTSGTEFPQDLSKYSLIIHCGACMLNEREVHYRMQCAMKQNVPFTNYGIAIAYMHGILKRSLSIFPELLAKLD